MTNTRVPVLFHRARLGRFESAAAEGGFLNQSGRAARSLAGAEEFSGLGKLAFASLWLLVFAIPWEDAVTISDFGTSARLIGMLTGGLGVFAILERGRVRRPAPGHILMALFVLLAAISYLWSLYPEGTL